MKLFHKNPLFFKGMLPLGGCYTAVKPLEYEDEYRALEQNLNLTM